MQVGTTKDQGLYNKPSAAVHPGATTIQYNRYETSQLMTRTLLPSDIIVGIQNINIFGKGQNTDRKFEEERD